MEGLSARVSPPRRNCERRSVRWRHSIVFGNSVSCYWRSTKRSARRGRSRTRSRCRKKNGESDPPGSRERSRSTTARHFQWSPQNGPSGFGSYRDGRALGHASGRGRNADGTAPTPGTGCRSADLSLSVRPSGFLPGVTCQADSDRSGPSESVASLLLVLALPYRPIPRRHRTGYREHRTLSWGAPHAGGGGSGGALRPRTPADETARRSGGDHQSRRANGGGDWRRYRRARASADPAGRAVGSTHGGRRTNSDSAYTNGRNRSACGEEGNPGPPGQDRRATGPHAGGQAGMRVYTNDMG